MQPHAGQNYIIPSDNREQQRNAPEKEVDTYYIIPSDNREQQPYIDGKKMLENYIIPSDNREQQPLRLWKFPYSIISYQAITGNNNI